MKVDDEAAIAAKKAAAKVMGFAQCVVCFPRMHFFVESNRCVIFVRVILCSFLFSRLTLAEWRLLSGSHVSSSL